MTETQPLVSVIITTRNEETVLETLLLSVRAQTYPSVQLIVVDNFSEDATPMIAQRLADLFIQAGPERSAQRNRGAQAAQGQYLLFLDADMELPSSVIARVIEMTKANPHLSLLAIPELSDGENFWGRCKALERNCYVDEKSVMAARFYDRPLFEALRGFDETLSGPEDWDLSQRAEQLAPLILLDQPLFHHEGRITLNGQIRKKFYYARSFARYWRKHPQQAQSQVLLVGRKAFWRHRRELADQPLLTAGLFFLRFAESCAGLAGALSGWREPARKLAAFNP